MMVDSFVEEEMHIFVAAILHVELVPSYLVTLSIASLCLSAVG